mmetsp:Transcript_18788/g.39110  ORF Transcript_18788/g.39110 Transcript_18788/m.39110 type:complete len:565 (+) Transcript_18788:185-1879(+)
MYRARIGYEAEPKPYLRNIHKAQAHAIHIRKMREIKSRKVGSGTTDNTLPATSKMKHLKLRQKQRAIKQQRNDDIAKENRMLLKKMTQIITTVPKAQGGGITEAETRRGKSLNAIGRSVELDRISKENQKILKRMMSVKSEHNVSNLKKDAARHKKLLRRLRMVNYEPAPSAMSEVSRRGREEIEGEMESRVSGRDEGDDLSSVVSEALSSSVKSSKPTINTKKKKKKRSPSPPGVPTSIVTTPTNKQLKEEKHRVKRDSAKDDLTLLANAALMDEVNEDTVADGADVSSPSKQLQRNMSQIDRTKGEFNVLRNNKKITIFKDSSGVGRQLMGEVDIMKKREGRIRVHLTWYQGEPEKKLDCFCDFNFADAIRIVDAPPNLVQEIHADVVELSKYLASYANVVEVGDGEAYILKLASRDECEKSLPDAPKEVKQGDRPTTQEIVVKIERSFTKMIPVTDAPETGLEKGVELSVHMTNSRRPGVIDILASPIKRDTPLTSQLPPRDLKISVSIPTLISLDQEHTDSYVMGLVESLNVVLDNGIKNEMVVGPKLHVRGGRPTTVKS